MDIKQLSLTGVTSVSKIRITIRAKYRQWKECFHAKSGVATGYEYYTDNNGVNFLIESIKNLKRK